MIKVEEFNPRKTQYGFRCVIDSLILETAAFLHHITMGDKSWKLEVVMVFGRGELKLYTDSAVSAEAMRTAIANIPQTPAEFFKDSPLIG